MNPFADLLAATAYRNWDSDRRLEETESQGVVAEVLFPNTIPPFFAQGNLTALEPTAADYERRWAGVQAHNRWLADFCAAAPGRRAGCAQVFLNDLDDTLAEVRWAKEHMHVFGGILLPNVAAELAAPAAVGSALRAALGPVRGARRRAATSTRAAACPTSATHDAARAIMLIELAWYAHRAVWHLIFGGVLERHPNLRVVLTEQGTGWIPRGLDTLDWFHRRMTHGGAAEAVFFGAVAEADVADADRVLPAQLLGRRELPAPVGERAALRGRHRSHHVGRRLSALRRQLPVHDRGAARRVRAVPAGRDEAMVETNAAAVYGFDLAALREIGDRVGPTVAEVQVPLDPADYPTDSTCNAFDREQVIKAW